MLGLICRMDDTGLGSQTRNLCKMLKPDRILLINSNPFNNNIQHPEWYLDFDCQITNGFPTNFEVLKFIKGLTHILTAETFYSHFMVSQANARGIKTFQQYNWEFLEHLQNPNLPKPYKWLAPSYWHLKKMEENFQNVVYLPPPIFVNEFKETREKNWNNSGKRKFVHIVGKTATCDRNGTLDLLAALRFSNQNYELIIKSQYPISEYMEGVNDKRVIFNIENIPETKDLYSGFDLMILPRRYGGLCLPMIESLISGLPVIMSDMEPNNSVLPPTWLIDSEKTDQFKARVNIDVHSINYEHLGNRLDWFATLSQVALQNEKIKAFDLGYSNYDSDILKPIYLKALEL